MMVKVLPSGESSEVIFFVGSVSLREIIQLIT